MDSRDVRYSDDYSTNKYGLKFLIVLFIVLVVVWILNAVDIFIIDKAIMNRGVVGAIIIFAIAYAGHFIVGFKHPFAKYYYILAIYAMVTYMSIYLTYHVFVAVLFPMIFALQYRARSVTIFSYILSITGILVSIIVGFKLGLCDANMLLLTYTTTANQIRIFSSGNLDFNNNLLLLMLYYGFPRCILITSAVPLLNHIANTITDKAIRELENKKMAETDGLTGLLNKNAFLKDAEIQFNSLGEDSGAFIFVDMDHFKSVNDNLGHAIGDMAIKDVAQELKDVFRQYDLVGRFGGDEFVIFITQIPEKLLRNRLEDLRNRMQKTYSDSGKEVKISASIGAVFFEKQPIYPFNRIMEMADSQVYMAKESGRNRVSITTVTAFIK